MAGWVTLMSPCRFRGTNELLVFLYAREWLTYPISLSFSPWLPRHGLLYRRVPCRRTPKPHNGVHAMKKKSATQRPDY